ncbi:MAG: PD-(D/E)XK nuclease family protein [Candidatus Palauibacterales bacterium]|nr:PD-(D/E)XK nuclease family protein [Candidatus Palauibacterales bacterium]MDP2530244.1 PD-(D/E)XK nuclease family protein [Candidatus Palauibacterales bacterium]MDP2583029.1 PD-(D/E)XK nuclease family protein [Candidatus Palauibacterales bacterium]
MIERVFLTWDRPALPAVARFLAERFAEDGALALGGVLVALPAARAGRRLTELLIEEGAARGLVLTPPDTRTTGQLPEWLYDSDQLLAGRLLARSAWAAVLRSLAPERRARVFPAPPEPADVAGWMDLAAVVQDLHEVTAAEGVTFEDVARACRRGPGFDDSSRWEVLADAQRSYHRQLAALDRVDRDAARWLAVERGPVESEREIVLVGVVEMPAVLRDLLRRLDETGARVTAIVHAPPDRGEAFDELGCVLPEVWGRREIDIPDEGISVVGRPPAQADEVVRRLSGPGERLGPDQVTLGVPDPELVPYLEQRLRMFGIPHRNAAGTPIERTDPYRLLAAAAAYLGDHRYPAFAGLLRHPDVARRLGVPDLLERADRHYRVHLPARVDAGRRGGRPAAEGQGRIPDDLDSLLGLGRLRGRRTVSEWMPAILALLARVYDGRVLDRSRPGDRRLVEACEILRDAAAGWARVHADLDVPCDAPAAMRLLLSEVERASVPPMPDRSAVELLGWLELHLDDAPALVLTGLDESHVPGSVNADLFLPDALRSRLGLVDNARRYARDVYLLSAMLASRDEVHFVVGRSTAEGDPVRPSRLLLATSGATLARRVRRLFGEPPGPAARLPRPGVEAAPRSAFRAPPEPTIRAAPRDHLRVTDFRLLLVRPYQFALARLLELEELEDRSRELDGLGFGTLAHDVLHSFGASEAARSEDPDLVRSALDEVLDRVSGDRFGATALPAVRLQVEQLRLRLRTFGAWHVERVRAGWETAAVEVSTPGTGAPLVVDGEPLPITGRIDRIDRNVRSGEWAILDYKTSAVPSSPDATHRSGRGASRRWVDLQLPLYRHLLPAMVAAGEVPAALAATGTTVRLGYVNVSREGTEASMASWTEDELASADEAARACVRLLRAGTFAFTEDEPVDRRSLFAALLGRGRLRAADEGDEGEDA